MKRLIETGIMIAAAYGFFGILYPELCLIEDTCQVVEEEPGENQSAVEGMQDIYRYEQSGHPTFHATDPLRDMSDLPPGDIRIKSTLLEYLYKHEQ